MSESDEFDLVLERAVAEAKSLRVSQSVRLLREALRTARSLGNAAGVIECLFRLTNSRDLLDPRMGRRTAVELIAMLEDDGAVRAVEPEFDEDRIAFLRTQLTTCAYDNLAIHTAREFGFNSTGMHDCIADGIEVCRRTSKPECIVCFREYATDVWLAADDPEMAEHAARACVEQSPMQLRSDRRYVGYRNLAWLNTLRRNIDAAVNALRKAWSSAADYHNPESARLDIHYYLRTILLPAGRSAEHADILGEPFRQTDEAPGENPLLDLRRALMNALEAACRKDFSAAAELLGEADRELAEKHCLSFWFEVRLRRIAAVSLAGDAEQADRLAAELRSKAEPARDWHSVRRLDAVLLDPENAGPVALPRELTHEQTPPESPADTEPILPPDDLPSEESVLSGLSDSESAGAEETAAEDEVELMPAAVALRLLSRRLGSVLETEGDSSVFWDDILNFPIDEDTTDGEVGRLLSLCRFAVLRKEQMPQVYRWLRKLIRGREEHAGTLCSAALLMDRLRESPVVRELGLSSAEVERMMASAAAAGQRLPGVLKAVGRWYLQHDQERLAEQLLARAFRLNRNDAVTATALAELYREQDRPRDALAVLDLCIRSGCEAPELLWEAGLSAFSLDRYDAAVTYFAELTQRQPDREWVGYYLAMSEAEQGHFDAAAAAIDRERGLMGEKDYHLDLLTSVIEMSGENPQAGIDRLNGLLNRPVSNVDYLAPGGFDRLFAAAWKALHRVTGDSKPVTGEAAALQMARIGFAPDPYFLEMRRQRSKVEHLDFYRITITQQVEPGWAENPACRSGESDWKAFTHQWGVVAEDEQQALDFVAAMQAAISDQPFRVDSVQAAGADLRDHPGIVWQGYRSQGDPESTGADSSDGDGSRH